jgi:hypothetical protein
MGRTWSSRVFGARNGVEERVLGGFSAAGDRALSKASEIAAVSGGVSSVIIGRRTPFVSANFVPTPSPEP